MSQITVDVQVPPSLLRKLDGKRLDLALQRGMSDATKIVMDQVQIYPPKPAGSRYIRTGVLRRSWRRSIKTIPGGVQGKVESSPNIARYNIWVKSPAYQAGVHRGRWATTDDDTKQISAPVGQAIENAIRKALR